MTVVDFVDRLDALVVELGYAPSTRMIAVRFQLNAGTLASLVSLARLDGWIATVRPEGAAVSFHSVTDAGRAFVESSRPPAPKAEPLTVDSVLTHRGETRALRGWAQLACIHPRELLRRMLEGASLAEAVEPQQPIPEPRDRPVGRPPGVAQKQRVGDPHFETWFPHDEPLPLDDADRLALGDTTRAQVRARIVDELTFDEDELTQAFMKAHPGGATLEEVGDFLGVTRERVRQIESAAVDALRRRAHLAGLHIYAREDAA